MATRARGSLTDQREWFTPADLAKRWNLSVRQVQRLISTGLLVAVNLSAKDQRPTYRVSAAEVDRYERRNESA